MRSDNGASLGYWVYGAGRYGAATAGVDWLENDHDGHGTFGPGGETFALTHRGRREILHSKVGIFLTPPEYARSRGFDVARLR